MSNVLALDQWCAKTKELYLGFITFHCQYTYKEHNHLANRLLKDALKLSAGNLSLQEYMEGALIYEHMYNLSF